MHLNIMIIGIVLVFVVILINCCCYFVVAVATTSTLVTSLTLDEIIFLVLSQENKYHRGIAESLKQNILKQSLELNLTKPNVYLTHETYRLKRGAWAILPIIRDVDQDLIRGNSKWILILEPNCHVNISILLKYLSHEDYEKIQYFGYPLYDKEATITHHFSFFQNPSQFKYPLLGAGVAMTVTLWKRLAHELPNATFPSEFSIDPAHELALFIWNRVNGTRLTPASLYHCSRAPNSILNKKKENIGIKECAVYRKEFKPCTKMKTHNGITEEQPLVDIFNRIIVGVKTCKKFHHERLPIVLNTWGRIVPHLRIFSDMRDEKLGTVATGVPNTEMGHCEKTIKILKLLDTELSYNYSLSGIRWVVLVDDDTILSVSALVRHLSCYSPYEDLYLGERYGYFLLNEAGYNYITGGGGIVLTRSTLRKLATNCTCPTIHSPDDMIIATCLSQFNIQATHSSNFHQARPIDYPTATTTHIDKTNIISFHKYWQIDPYDVYEKWFKENDENFLYRNSIKIKSNEQKQRKQQSDTVLDEVQIIKGVGNNIDDDDDGRHNNANTIFIKKHSDYEMNHTDL
uniref:CSON010663 protein n=1 Tax=Culicoides sonorensis TaxID=179676 RepID=A0A336M264_CULSO